MELVFIIVGLGLAAFAFGAVGVSIPEHLRRRKEEKAEAVQAAEEWQEQVWAYREERA